MASIFGDLNSHYYNDYRNFGLTNIMTNPLMTLSMLKQSDGSTCVEAYEDKYKQCYHLIYKEVDGSYLYILKDKNFTILKKRTHLIDIDQAKNEILNSADNGRWSGEKEMYVKTHLNPVKVVEHELTYDPPRSYINTKKSFKKQLEEEVSGWCQGILNE